MACAMLAKPSFEPMRGDDLRLRIELHAEAALVVGGLRAAQTRYALRGRIAMRARLGDRLDQLVDDVLRRRQVRIAHAQVDDVGAACARRRLQPVDLGENVGRQTLDAVEVLVQGTPLPRLVLERPRSATVNDGYCGAGPPCLRPSDGLSPGPLRSMTVNAVCLADGFWAIANTGGGWWRTSARSSRLSPPVSGTARSASRRPARASRLSC